MSNQYAVLRQKGLAKRYRAERRFRLFGLAALCSAIFILAVLLGSIIYNSIPAFTQGDITLSVYLDAEKIDPQGTRSEAVLRGANYNALWRAGLYEMLSSEKLSRRDKRAAGKLISSGAGSILASHVIKNPHLIGENIRFTFPLSGDANQFIKGFISEETAEEDRRLTDKQIGYMRLLQEKGAVKNGFALPLFLNGDSREPELAGVRGALQGSILTMLVTLLMSFPLGVLAAIYLQELAPRNRFTDLIEVNINNLAAVPSIVFGLLGLGIFLNFFGMPRSAPLVGGMVLALMTLPTIIIATRIAIASVPPSIREAALGMGASKMQVIFHHVLPLAMPGILTGTIIGIARAMGETAPLLMVGMLAFVVDPPTGFTSSATVLPAQIYMWADNPETAFQAKTSAAIIILLAVLICMNALAIWLRNRYERRW